MIRPTSLLLVPSLLNSAVLEPAQADDFTTRGTNFFVSLYHEQRNWIRLETLAKFIYFIGFPNDEDSLDEGGINHDANSVFYRTWTDDRIGVAIHSETPDNTEFVAIQLLKSLSVGQIPLIEPSDPIDFLVIALDVMPATPDQNSSYARIAEQFFGQEINQIIKPPLDPICNSAVLISPNDNHIFRAMFFYAKNETHDHILSCLYANAVTLFGMNSSNIAGFVFDAQITRIFSAYLRLAMMYIYQAESEQTGREYTYNRIFRDLQQLFLEGEMSSE